MTKTSKWGKSHKYVALPISKLVFTAHVRVSHATTSLTGYQATLRRFSGNLLLNLQHKSTNDAQAWNLSWLFIEPAPTSSFPSAFAANLCSAGSKKPLQLWIQDERQGNVCLHTEREAIKPRPEGRLWSMDIELRLLIWQFAPQRCWRGPRWADLGFYMDVCLIVACFSVSAAWMHHGSLSSPHKLPYPVYVQICVSHMFHQFNGRSNYVHKWLQVPYFSDNKSLQGVSRC